MNSRGKKSTAWQQVSPYFFDKAITLIFSKIWWCYGQILTLNLIIILQELWPDHVPFFFLYFFVGKTSGLTRIVFLTNWGYEAFLLQVKFCFLVHTSLYNTTMFCILCKTQSSWINAFSCVFFGKRTEIFLIKTDMRNDLVTSSMRVSVFLETHHSSIFLKMNTICLAIIFLTHK